MLMAAGNIQDRYQVIGLVFAVASRAPENKGCSQVLGLGECYQDAARQLEASAASRGADGVIHVGFEHRYSSSVGCGGATTTVFEVYAWGTAIKLQ